MPVLVEGISVVVRRDVIARRYPGGWDAFVRDAPNRTLCADPELARLGFMVPADVEEFVTRLASHGIRFKEAGKALDLVVVDQMNGPTTPCDWIELGRIALQQGRVGACRLAGSSVVDLATPEGWAIERSLSARFGFVPTGTEKEAMRFLRHENGLDVYEDLQTGREVYIGRTGAGRPR
jgi:hypothetical protein